MNRAEKRRQERELKKKKLYSNAEIEKIREDARSEAFEKVFGVLFSVPYMALRQMGYGRVRLGRFHDKMSMLLKGVENGSYDLNEALEMLKEKYKIVYVSKGDGNFEVGVDRETDN